MGSSGGDGGEEEETDERNQKEGGILGAKASTAPAPNAATVSKPTFSFDSQPAASGASSINLTTTTNEDDPTSSPDDGKFEVGQVEDPDEVEVYRPSGPQIVHTKA